MRKADLIQCSVFNVRYSRMLLSCLFSVLVVFSVFCITSSSFASNPDRHTLINLVDAKLHLEHIHLRDTFVTALPAGELPAMPVILARTLPETHAPRDSRDPWYDTIALLPDTELPGDRIVTRRVGPFRRSALAFQDLDGDGQDEIWLETLPLGKTRERQLVIAGRRGARPWLDVLAGKGFDQWRWEDDGRGGKQLLQVSVTNRGMEEETVWRYGANGFSPVLQPDIPVEDGIRRMISRPDLPAKPFNQVYGRAHCVKGMKTFRPEDFRFEYSMAPSNEGLELIVRVLDRCPGHPAEKMQLSLAPVSRWHEPLVVTAERTGTNLRISSNSGSRSVKGRRIVVSGGWGLEMKIPLATLQKYEIHPNDPLVRFCLRASHARGGQPPAEVWVLSSSGKPQEGIEGMTLAPWRP